MINGWKFDASKGCTSLTVWKVSSPENGVICSNKYFNYVFIVLLLPVHRGAVFQWSLSWLKQFIFSARHSFSSFAFFFSFRSFFFSRSSLIFRRASFAISFSSRLESLKFMNDICGNIVNYVPFIELKW